MLQNNKSKTLFIFPIILEMQWYASIDLDRDFRPHRISLMPISVFAGEKKFLKERVGRDSKWVKHEGEKVYYNDNNIFFAINFSSMPLLNR